MKKIWMTMINGFAIYVGNVYFPERVVVGSLLTMMLAPILMSITTTLIAKFITWLHDLAVVAIELEEREVVGAIGLITVVFSYPIVILITPVKLFICEIVFPDFAINGFITYLILSVFFRLTRIKGSNNDIKVKQEVSND